MQIIYGARMSLGNAFAGGVLATALGTVVGIVSAYATGWLSALITWFSDLVLTFPLVIFSLGGVSIFTEVFYRDVPGLVRQQLH